MQEHSRTILVWEGRRRIFRRMKQKARGILCGFPRFFAKYDGIIGKQTVPMELCGDALKILLSARSGFVGYWGGFQWDGHIISPPPMAFSKIGRCSR